MEDYSIEGIKGMMRVILHARSTTQGFHFWNRSSRWIAEILARCVTSRGSRRQRKATCSGCHWIAYTSVAGIGQTARRSGKPETSARLAGAEMRAQGHACSTRWGWQMSLVAKPESAAGLDLAGLGDLASMLMPQRRR